MDTREQYPAGGGGGGALWRACHLVSPLGQRERLSAQHARLVEQRMHVPQCGLHAGRHLHHRSLDLRGGTGSLEVSRPLRNPCPLARPPQPRTPSRCDPSRARKSARLGAAQIAAATTRRVNGSWCGRSVAS